MISVTSSLGEILILVSSLNEIEQGKHYGWGFCSIGLERFCSFVQPMGAYKKEKLLLGYTEF